MFSNLMDFIVKPAVFAGSMGLIDLDEKDSVPSRRVVNTKPQFTIYCKNPQELNDNLKFFHSILHETYKDVSDKEALMDLSKEELIQKYSKLYSNSNKFFNGLHDSFNRN